MSRRARLLGLAGALVVTVYAGGISLRPLNANDLFWHLATGREILRTHAVPRADPFSFASARGPWIDHEWLWQVAAQSLYGPGDTVPPAERPDGSPGAPGTRTLVVFGVVVAAAAFAVAAFALAAEGLPAAGLVVLGLLAAETARERLMVRPETMSLFFLALVLVILGPSAPDHARWRRGLGVAAVTALWANVHPAALIVPGVVVLHAMASRWGPAGDRTRTEDARAWLISTLSVAGLAAAGTLLNPYGWTLWTVPLKLSALVKTRAFFNPEWLRPPLSVFPVFYAAVGLVALTALVSVARTRRLPEGRILIALAVGVLALQQMRHLGLFAIAFLLSGGAILRALDPRAVIGSLIARPALGSVAVVGGLIAAVPAHAPGVYALQLQGDLDAGRFPVEACERIAREAPELRLFNDVQFGGYLIWRFYPPKQVFIDGRNEIYEDLLRRLGRIQTGEAPYEDWKRLVAELGLDGALVKDKGDAGMVTFRLPPERAGGAPHIVRRAFSAVYFPIADWALVYFDDTAMVFVKRGGAGESWRMKGEYRALNPEDAAFVLDKASHDPAFAAQALEEARRRVAEAPRCVKAERLLEALRGGPGTRTAHGPDR